MFCSKCGSQLDDGLKFCPNCGSKIGGVDLEGVRNTVNDSINNVEKQIGDAVDDVKNSLNGGAPVGGGQRLQTDRGLLVYILLSIVTCGIYGYYFIYKMAHDVNIACEGDGEQTGGLVAYILFSFLTCGIYSWYWLYKLGNRLSANAPKYGMTFQENGTTIIMWCIFGSLVCGIGPYIAMHILIKNTNAICAAYNRKYGF